MSIKVEWRRDRERWQVTYYVEGKRKRPLFKERKAADQLARKIQLGLAVEDPDSITIDDAGKKYYSTESVKKAPKSKSNDKGYINLHHYFMTEVQGIERLRTVGLEDMEAFRDWLPTLTEQPWPISEENPKHKPMKMGPSTVNRCLAVMKHFYKRHIQWKNIVDNPCTYLEFLGSEDNGRKAMTDKQYLKTLAKVDDWDKPSAHFMYLTGSPAICLERMDWSDVDLVKRVYSTVRKKGPKAQAKRYYFSMTDDVFALFVMLRNRSPVAEGAVFRDLDGRRMLADRITRLMNDAIRAAGIRDVTWYCVRHKLASDMTAANVSMELIRQAMGHANIATTQKYANKVGLKSISSAIDSVRGGKVVANEENALRTEEVSFGS